MYNLIYNLRKFSGVSFSDLIGRQKLENSITTKNNYL